jgi:hypothetical protein
MMVNATKGNNKDEKTTSPWRPTSGKVKLGFMYETRSDGTISYEMREAE